MFAVASAGTTVLVLVAGACSSSASTPASTSEAGAAAETSTSMASDAAPSGPCSADRVRLAEDDASVCCAGLFKTCVDGECVCSTVECGTPAMQPPPGVPCCFDPMHPVSIGCEQKPIGSLSQCICGDQADD